MLYSLGVPVAGGSNHVARVHVEGFIRDDRALRRRLDEIAADEHARALLVVIDSSGGSAAGAEALYGALRKVAATKPVAALMGATAASGAYLAAIGADRIFARSATLTGSIGVILQAPQVAGLLETLGIGVEVVRSGPLKTVPNPVERLTPAGRAAAQALVDEIFAMFVDMVAERRPAQPGGSAGAGGRARLHGAVGGRERSCRCHRRRGGGARLAGGGARYRAQSRGG